MNITILGSVPSKKNSKRIFRAGGSGKLFIAPSAHHDTWHTDAMWQVASWRNEQPASVRNLLPLRACKVEISFYPKSSRAWDLTNKAESVMDLLVDARIIEDDNTKVVQKLTLVPCPTDTANPRAEITITYGTT